MALPPALVNSLSQGKIELSVPLKPEPWLAQPGCTEDLLFVPWPWGGDLEGVASQVLLLTLAEVFTSSLRVSRSWASIRRRKQAWCSAGR